MQSIKNNMRINCLLRLSVCLGALVASLSMQAQSFSNAVMALNPVAYWPLNETSAPPNPALQATNLGNLGSAFNAPFAGNVTFGEAGALPGTSATSDRFDGVSGDALAPYGSSISHGPSFTVEAWLLSHNINATQCPLSDFDATSPRSGWLIYMDISNPGQYTFRAYAQNGTSPSLAVNIGAPSSVAQDTWNHLVIVVSNAVTATNVYGYLDGVLVAGPTALPAYVPDDGLNGGTFSIGARADSSFFFDGNIQEVAYYSAALDADTIAAHYSAGTNSSPSTPYSTLVLNSSPALYYHLGEAAAPLAHNYGSYGAAANGYYQTGTVPGVAGPSFGAFGNGFGSDDFATQFSPLGTQSAGSGPTVNCAFSNPTLLDDTNSITIAAWANVPTGAVGWFEGLLGRGDNSFRFTVDTNGLPHFADGGNSDIVGPNAVNDGKWHYWVGTYNSVNSNATLYIDSVSAGTASWNPVSGDPDKVFLIGGAPDYAGRNFVGDVAQVAIFTNVLTASNIQSIYNLTAPSPFEEAVVGLQPLAYWPLTETAPPPAPVTFTATNLGTVGASLNAAFNSDVVYGVQGALASDPADSADGFNGSTMNALCPYTADLANASSSSFTIEAWLLSHNINATQCAVSDMDAASPRSGWLIYMDISNPGQYTFRAYAQNGTSPSLAVNIGAPSSVAQDTWNHLVVVVSNSVAATNVYGYLNGVLVAGPTALPAYVPDDGQNSGTLSIGSRSDNSYFFDGVIDELAYYTNALDANAVAAHYNAGTVTKPAQSYSSLVLAQQPIVYFRMDEASVGQPYPAPLPVAQNYGTAGEAAAGYYEPGTEPGVQGPFGPNSWACGFNPANTGVSDTAGPGVLCDPFNFGILNTSDSLTLAGWIEVPTNAIAGFEDPIGRSDQSYRFSVDTGGLPHFAAAPNGDIVGTTPLNDGNWHLWAGVYDASDSKANLYIDGLSVASATWSALSADDQIVMIGGAPDYDANNNSGVNRGFTGSVAHVAIFTNALSQAEIQAAYATIGVPPSPPSIVQEPPPTEIIFVGGTLNASVVASGVHLTYQWAFQATNLLTGATTAGLSLPGVQSTNAGSYTCVVANRYGSVTSSPAVLTVVSPQSVAFDSAVLAEGALAYYPLNEPTGSTNAHDYIQGNNGTYETNALAGQPGVPGLELPGEDLSVDIQSSTTNGWVAAPFGTLEGENSLTIPNLSFACWIYPVGTQNDSLGLIFDRGGAVGGLDMGQGTSSQMLGYTWNSGAADTYNFVSGLTPPQNQWSFVALTISPNEAALYMYNANGRQSAVNAIPHAEGVLDGAWRLGNDALADPARTFNGRMAGVAVFPSTLTVAQLNELYDAGAYGTTNIAPVVVVPSAPVAVNQGGDGTIASTVVDGPAPYSYQWGYFVSGTTNVIVNATNSSLTLTNVQSVQSTYSYFVVVSNNFGATTSSNVTLSVLSGPPVLVQDVFPPLTVVPAGTPLTLSVVVSGTEPFAYQWSNQVSAIAGETNSIYSFNALSGTNSYVVFITNTGGSITSSMAAVIGVTGTLPPVSFNGNGTNWTLNQPSGWPGGTNVPNITGNVLILTDGTNGEADSAWYNLPQYVSDGFTASYIYQVQPASSVADGVTFCIQNSTNSAVDINTNGLVSPIYDVGGGGGDLGYFGITPSVAFEMNVYTGANGGVGIEFGTNGLTADSTPQLTPYGPTAPVNIASFDPITVQITYSHKVVNIVLADGKLSYTTNYPCDIPATIGGPSGYVGFTGGDGGVNSIQTVSDFTFQSTIAAPSGPVLTIAKGSSGTLLVSWPAAGNSSFVLQQSAALNGTWTGVATTPVVVGSDYQATITAAATAQYYRLKSP